MSDAVRRFLQGEKVSRDELLRGADGKDGKDGRDGKDGLSIKGDKGDKGDKGERGERGLNGKDGLSIRGEKGDKGDKGDDGVSIIDTKQTPQGELEIYYSDGKVKNVGRIRGQDGRSGSGGSGAALTKLASEIQRLEDKEFDNTVIVKTPSDLQNIDSTKNYMIDGAVDMGSTSIVVPPTGLSLSGLNGARDTAILYSSDDNYTMFVSPDGSYSGDVVLESCTIDVTGTGSKVFELDNDENSGALDMSGVNFGRFSTAGVTSLGSLSNYRQLLNNNIGYIKIQDGLTFNGAWTGIAVTTTIALALPAITLFKEGTGFTIDNVRSDINFLSVDDDAILFDFDEANITSKGGFSLNNVRTNATDPIPNISGSSSYARFRNCDGIRNTYVGGQWTISSETTTNIVSANTPVKMAGGTAYTDMQWFTNSTDNAFVYDGDQVIEIECKGVISISGGNNDQVNIFFRQWDDSASAYVSAPKAQATLNGGLLGTRAEGIPFFGYFRLSNNDRIEVWVENISDTTDVTAASGGLVSITERAS